MMCMSDEKKARLDEEINHFICCNMGKLYVMAVDMGFNLQDFSDKFLTSHFCTRSLDTPYSRFQNEEEDVSMDYLLREISPRKEESGYAFSDEVAFWIGFIYRFLYFKTGLSSSELKEKVPFSYLEAKAYGLLTLDEEESLDIIKKDRKI